MEFLHQLWFGLMVSKVLSTPQILAFVTWPEPGLQAGRVEPHVWKERICLKITGVLEAIFFLTKKKGEKHWKMWKNYTAKWALREWKKRNLHFQSVKSKSISKFGKAFKKDACFSSPSQNSRPLKLSMACGFLHSDLDRVKHPPLLELGIRNISC